MFRRRIVGVGIAVVVLFVFGFSQLYAQSGLTLEGLSSRITTLSRRVSALSTTKASNRELVALESRVATLEAKLGDSTPVATATRRRATATPTRRPPTPTPTRIRPTATSTPVQPYIRITRNMNVRLGPDTTYAVVGYATIGQEFDITGRNTDGSWWRIEFEGQNVWIYAPYVTAVNAKGIRAVPTPVPPTATPGPVPSSSRGDLETATILGAGLVLRDQEAMGRLEQWQALSSSQQGEAFVLAAEMLIDVASYCDLSIEDAAILVDEYGEVLDNAGYTTRKTLPVRQIIMHVMLNYAREYPRRALSCDDLFRGGIETILEDE